MDNLEILKNELISQKEKLVEKGYEVATKFTNPSPSEITTAIESVHENNLSEATATEEDVLEGKTFYAGDFNLKTGTLVKGSDSDYYNAFLTMLFGADYGNWTYQIPFVGQTAIRPYCFCEAGEMLSGKLVLPEGIEKVGKYSFDSTNITEIQFPESITTLDSYAFSHCSNLKEIKIPDSVTSIGTYCFYQTNSHSSMYIGTGISTLPNFALSHCGTTKTISLPANIKQIASSNFAYATTVEDFYFNGVVTFTNTVFLTNHNDNLHIWMPFDIFPTMASTTNISKLRDHFISKVTLQDEASFPEFDSQKDSLIWFGSIQDADTKTNELSAPNGAGEYYCKLKL